MGEQAINNWDLVIWDVKIESWSVIKWKVKLGVGFFQIFPGCFTNMWRIGVRIHVLCIIGLIALTYDDLLGCDSSMRHVWLLCVIRAWRMHIYIVLALSGQSTGWYSWCRVLFAYNGCIMSLWDRLSLVVFIVGYLL